MTPRQVEFLCYEGREALFGGSAGGGKSVALLAASLQWIEQPGANSLILRRTFVQLAKSDSILNKSKDWLANRRDGDGHAVRWNGDERKWTFPNGNTLEFGHMEHEDAKYDYQGGVWAFIGVDEATQFTEPMLAYPRSRQRRPAKSKVPLRWRGGTNPGGVGHEAIKARYIKDLQGNNPATPHRQFFPARIEDNPHIDRLEYVTALRESGVDPLTLAQLL
ncbi:terminase large subunit domain-containing protein, partial [Zavarzinella formosa]|uniref:terminase large subunit domain-containing protein n=1 Tax=Zavarzinella formosa TaxID=360055 RepID=UPI00036B611B